MKLGSFDEPTDALCLDLSTPEDFHFRRSMHARRRFAMKSGMARMATQVMIEDGNERPGFSKAVSENSIPSWSNSLNGLIVKTEK